MVMKDEKIVTQQFFSDNKLNNGWTSVEDILALLNKVKTM